MTSTSLHSFTHRLQPVQTVMVSGFKFSPQMVRLMDDIVEANIEYSTDRAAYHMDYSDLTEFHKEQLMAQLMADSQDVACEATSADNARFESKMLPALINMLKNSTDKEVVYEFVTAWREGVANYSSYLLPELLSNRVEEYNFEYASDAWRELAD